MANASWNGLKSWLMIVLALSTVPLLAVAAHTSAEAAGESPPIEPRRGVALEVMPGRVFLHGDGLAHARVVARNVGEASEVVRLEIDSGAERLAARFSGPTAWTLEPGQSMAATLVLGGSGATAGPGSHVVALVARTDSGGAAYGSLLVEVAMPRPPIDLVRIEPPPVELAQVQIPEWSLPAPCPVTLAPAWGAPACPAALPCPHAPLAPGEVVVHLTLRGRIVDGKLVLDLDEPIAALLRG